MRLTPILVCSIALLSTACHPTPAERLEKEKHLLDSLENLQQIQVNDSVDRLRMLEKASAFKNTWNAMSTEDSTHKQVVADPDGAAAE